MSIINLYNKYKMVESNTDLFCLPFHHITNVELYKTLESTDKYIKYCLENKTFSKYIQATLPDNTIFKTPCKYYTTEQVNTLIKHCKNSHLKLLHHNIRSIDKHYGEILALSSIGTDFDLIALTEIGPSNLRLH